VQAKAKEATRVVYELGTQAYEQAASLVGIRSSGPKDGVQ
jgi:hypothetical protein